MLSGTGAASSKTFDAAMRAARWRAAAQLASIAPADGVGAQGLEA